MDLLLATVHFIGLLFLVFAILYIGRLIIHIILKFYHVVDETVVLNDYRWLKIGISLAYIITYFIA